MASNSRKKPTLAIPFSHRFYSKVFELGGIPLEQPTRLLNYAVVWRLSEEFKRYDATFWPGRYGMAAEALQFELGARGPWLILFLATRTGNKWIRDSELAPGLWHWTTIRRPWRRVRRSCESCALLAGPEDRGCLGRADHGPCAGWRPVIPAKYREARGGLVRIVYQPEPKGGKS